MTQEEIVYNILDNIRISMICDGIPNDRPNEDIVRIYTTASSIFDNIR